MKQGDEHSNQARVDSKTTPDTLVDKPPQFFGKTADVEASVPPDGLLVAFRKPSIGTGGALVVAQQTILP